MSHLIDYFLAWEISEYIILFIIEDPVVWYLIWEKLVIGKLGQAQATHPT